MKQTEKMSYWTYLGGPRMVMVQYIQTLAPMTQRLVHMLYTEKSCWTPGMVDWAIFLLQIFNVQTKLFFSTLEFKQNSFYQPKAES